MRLYYLLIISLFSLLFSQDDIVLGCIDLNACNYNSQALQDDQSCTYPEKNFDCNNNCIVDKDCFGVCGGTSLVDECGICDGDGFSCKEFVFQEGTVKRYTDRDYTKIDFIADGIYSYDDYTLLTSGLANGNISHSISFGYEGDIYKNKNFLLSFGLEFMLGRKNNFDHIDYSLHSFYLSPIVNFENHNIALYSRFGYNIINFEKNEMIFNYFKSGNSGLNLGAGLAFVVNDIRILIDYNIHNISNIVNGQKYDIIFQRFGITFYHKLITQLREKK